jgi:hypothetical protein
MSVKGSSLLRPRSSLRKKFGELDLEYAELVCPWVTHYPEVESSLLLVVPPCCAERLKAFHLGFDVVGLQVEMHPFLGDLLLIGLLQLVS